MSEDRKEKGEEGPEEDKNSRKKVLMYITYMSHDIDPMGHAIYVNGQLSSQAFDFWEREREGETPRDIKNTSQSHILVLRLISSFFIYIYIYTKGKKQTWIHLPHYSAIYQGHFIHSDANWNPNHNPAYSSQLQETYKYKCQTAQIQHHHYHHQRTPATRPNPNPNPNPEPQQSPRNKPNSKQSPKQTTNSGTDSSKCPVKAGQPGSSTRMASRRPWSGVWGIICFGWFNLSPPLFYIYLLC